MYLNYIDEIRGCLGETLVSNRGSDDENIGKGLSEWIELTSQIQRLGNTVFLVGNGASASMASHFACDLAKNAHINTQVFSDLSLITAIANDISFEHVFSEPLSKRFKKGDMLVAISSSGRSANVLRAVEIVKNSEGNIVTLSAMDFDNPLRDMGDINIYVPAKTYGLAETCHAAILHFWIDQLLLKKFK